MYKVMVGVVDARQAGGAHLGRGSSWLLRRNAGKHNMLNCTVIAVQLLQHLHCSHFQRHLIHSMMVYFVDTNDKVFPYARLPCCKQDSMLIAGCRLGTAAAEERAPC